MGNSEDSKRTDLSDIHAVQLEMMKTLAAVFEKNGLRYALYCGTLLGAIRHRGFIPWDDDVDLVMPLEDYRRFLRLAAKELPRGYVVLTPENILPYLLQRRADFKKLRAEYLMNGYVQLKGMDDPSYIPLEDYGY